MLILFFQLRQSGDNTVALTPIKEHTKKTITINICKGLIAIILGGQITVSSASAMARLIDISENIIGLTIVGVGTSLPELMTFIVASKKGHRSIAIGDIIDVCILLMVSLQRYIPAKYDKYNYKIGVL